MPVPTGYANSDEALKDVQDTYIDWTRKLSETSFQLSLAIIGANWAAFGAVDKILSNVWAKFSLIVVIADLAINLIGTWRMSEILGRKVNYARKDTQGWNKDWGEKEYPWPFTRESEGLSRFLREVKVWFPLVAAALFFVALFCHP